LLRPTCRRLAEQDPGFAAAAVRQPAREEAAPERKSICALRHIRQTANAITMRAAQVT
jgi:hypothetical protein